MLWGTNAREGQELLLAVQAVTNARRLFKRCRSIACVVQTSLSVQRRVLDDDVCDEVMMTYASARHGRKV